MSLKGSLTSINLADIIQLVSNSKQTGRFILTRTNGQQGMIYLKKGEIIHATVEEFKGEDAIFTLIAWDEGEFIFEEGAFDVPTSIQRPITSLLMEAARRIDEWKLLRKKIGSIDAIPEFSDINRQERRKISLSTMEWVIVAKIDGKKNINQISKECAVNIFDTARIIYGMVTSDLIKLR
jgi:hypothetical protein